MNDHLLTWLSTSWSFSELPQPFVSIDCRYEHPLHPLFCLFSVLLHMLTEKLLQMIQWSDMNESNWIANRFRLFSKPVWPTRTDTKEWFIGIAGSADINMGNTLCTWYAQSVQSQAPLRYGIGWNLVYNSLTNLLDSRDDSLLLLYGKEQLGYSATNNSFFVPWKEKKKGFQKKYG